MRLSEFFNFRRQSFGLFFNKKETHNKSSFQNLKTDYNLSRALYSSAPAEGSEYLKYALGNYATKNYIDMFGWHIGTPDIQAESETYTQAIQAFIKKNETQLLNICKQTMIDGKHYVWARVETNEFNVPELKLKQILLENVVEERCVKNIGGGYKKFVIETKENWKEGDREKKCTINIELEAGKETITITGDLPAQYTEQKTINKNAFSFVPVFCLYNNKLLFLEDGIPEIAPVVPFIRRYDDTLRKLGRHVDDILEPRLQVKVKDVTNFIKYSFGVDEARMARIAEGKETVDPTQFKFAFIDGDDSSGGVNYVTPNNNVEGTLALLKLLHWIIVEMTMPEYLYGTALDGNYASVKEQSPVWIKKVEGRQKEYSEFYYWLAEVFKRAKIATAGRDIFAQDGGVENITITWEELSSKDDVALMNALVSFVNAMEKALELGLISPQSAFNTLKTFIPILADFEDEQEAAQEWIKFKLRLEALQDRIRSGDIEASSAIDELFSESA